MVKEAPVKLQVFMPHPQTLQPSHRFSWLKRFGRLVAYRRSGIKISFFFIWPDRQSLLYHSPFRDRFSFAIARENPKGREEIICQPFPCLLPDQRSRHRQSAKEKVSLGLCLLPLNILSSPVPFSVAKVKTGKGAVTRIFQGFQLPGLKT